MKVICRLAVFFVVMISFSFRSVDDVVFALKNGNANQVAKYFDNTVQILLIDKNYTYSKSQAELVLRDFFVTNGIKDFQVVQKSDKPGSQFCIGTLETRNGIFRTTLFLKLKGDRQLLQELRFER